MEGEQAESPQRSREADLQKVRAPLEGVSSDAAHRQPADLFRDRQTLHAPFESGYFQAFLPLILYCVIN